MATHDIFYSWQSDLPNSTNRGFIEDCLNRAIKDVRANDQLNLEPCLDRDTRGVPGSPDIAATIFDKIKKADIFVADVSFIDSDTSKRRTPNPNVLVELGYAAGCIGWGRIICVFNEASGGIEELPFDIRPRRVRAYKLVEGQDKPETRKALVGVLKSDITDILHAPDEAEAEAFKALLSNLAPKLNSVIILGEELEHRNINPWLNALRSQFGATSGDLRHFATLDAAIKHSMATELEELAGKLDEVANLRMHLGSWGELQNLVANAVAKATAIKQARIDGVPLAAESVAEVRELLTTKMRKMVGLAARADDLASQGRVDDLRVEPSQIGHSLLEISHFSIDVIRPGLAQQLRGIGRELHLIETMRVVLDGGRSIRAIVDRIKTGATALSDLMKSLGNEDR